MRSEVFSEKFTFCFGASMFPTFINGDQFDLQPYAAEDMPQYGDIIVFISPDEQKKIVHRVVYKDSRRKVVRTCGDNNSKWDPEDIPRANIIGKVVKATRQNKIWYPYNGLPGLLTFSYNQGRKLLRNFIGLFLKIFDYQYKILCECTCTCVAILCPLRFQCKVVGFKRGSEQEWHLYLKDTRIGKLVDSEGTRCWQIRKRYCLVVDVRKLPIPSGS